VPFKTKQTPVCDYEVAFSLVYSSLSFVSVEAFTLSSGFVFVKETDETKETTHAMTLRAFVDGQTAVANFSVTVKPKLEIPPVIEETSIDKLN
jgi:hypothetical protein